MLYELRDIKKAYDSRTVLDIPKMRMEGGKIYGLMGPNGAGKTTLLQILGFLLPPTHGSLYFMEELVDFSQNRLSELRRQVVLVHQNPIMFTTTVYRNVEFPLQVRGIERSRRQRIIEEMLELVGMRDFKDERADRLSGGETQRVAIARALCCHPRVILFDEPTASVDVEHQIAIEQIIQGVNRDKGISVIFTTHNHIQAARLSHHTFCLFEGRLVPSVMENLFNGVIEEEGKGRSLCLIQNRLRLQITGFPKGRVRLFLDPSRLFISPSDDQDRGTAARFRGRLIQLSEESGMIRAVVDVGFPVTVLLPRERYLAMRIVPGEEVFLAIPEESIEILGS